MSTNSQNIYNRNLAADFTNHNVLAEPKDIPWLAAIPPSSTLPSKEIIDQATKLPEDDGGSYGRFDDGCERGEELYRSSLPVYAVHGLRGLGGAGDEFELTWANENAEENCTAPAEKSELFVNMGAKLVDGEGHLDNTSRFFWERSLTEGKSYYMAVPNEKYLLLIQHFIYKFPHFLRDENGDPVPKVEEESKSSEYTDIRSILFEDLKWNPGTNRGADSIHPYVPGCACDNDAKPYADINLAFTDAIVPGSEKTMKYTVTHEDLAQMSFCKCPDIKTHVYNFEGIKPETRFGTEEFFTSILQKQGVDLSDYITEGQYAVFYVGFSPERHADDTDCHDQVGFRYAFAFNLKDRPAKKDPSPCQANPCFVAKHDDAQNYAEDFGYDTAPKLYDVPQEIIDKYFVHLMKDAPPESFMEVQYPGKIYKQHDSRGNDIKDENITDCLYLAGREVNPELGYYFKSEQPMLGIQTWTDRVQDEDNNWRNVTKPYYTQKEILADSPTNSDLTYGLSTVTQILAQDSCNKYNSVISHQYDQYDDQDSEEHKDSDSCEDGYCFEYNTHLELNFFIHTTIAINNTSVFGTYFDGREHLI